MNISNQQISNLSAEEIRKKILAHHDSSNYTLNENTLRKLHNRLYEIDETAISNNNLPPPPAPQLVRRGGKRKMKKTKKYRKSRRNRKSMKNRKSRRNMKNRKYKK